MSVGVPVSDIAPATTGVPSNAQGGMPGSQSPQLPMTGQIAQGAGQGGVPAATETPPPPFDLSTLTPEQQSFLQAEIAKQLKPTIDQQFNNLRRAKDTEVKTAAERARDLQLKLEANEASTQTMIAEFTRIAQERGIPKEVIDAVSYQASQAAAGKIAEHQQLQSSWESVRSAELKAHVESLNRLRIDQETGQALFDIKDPDIARAFYTYLDAYQRDIQTGMTDPNIALQARRAWDALEQIKVQKREAGIRRVLQSGITSTQLQRAEQQQHAQQLQAQRGPQITAPPSGGGGAAQTKEQLMSAAKAQAKNPGDAYEVHRIAMGMLRQAQEQQRNQQAR